MKLRIIQTLCLLLIACLLSPVVVSAQTVNLASGDLSLEEINLGLLNEQTLKQWYEINSGNHGDEYKFGAYVTLGVGNDLYIGMGSARPAEDIGDGSYFARFNGANLVAIAKPNEQGLHKMFYDGEFIHIAGTDPQPPDGWEAGNHYTYSPTSYNFTKYRDVTNGLTNVIHTWGLWKPETTLYAAVSSHDGSFPASCTYGVTCMGQIFTSLDNGATWTFKSNLGDYRAYDIRGFNEKLYAIHNDEYQGPLSMSQSTDDGNTWSVLPGLTDNLLRVHMIEFKNRLLAVSFDRQQLAGVDNAGNISFYPLPMGYRVGTTYEEGCYTDYQVMTVAKSELYLIAEKQSTGERVILRTYTLTDWEQIATSDHPFISLSYWWLKDWLVIASAGTDAALWKVDLDVNPTVIPLQSLQVHKSPFPSLSPVTAIIYLSILIGILTLSWLLFLTLRNQNIKPK